MQIITLPTILPGELNLEELNQKLRQGDAQLDWSAVISAPESQLEILLNHLYLDKNADTLGVEGEIAENIANDIIRYFDNQKISLKNPENQLQNHKRKKSPLKPGKLVVRDLSLILHQKSKQMKIWQRMKSW
ncbi:MAG: hypothetical protein HC836_13510 [Richelia sp. RM2_1_2]|nr:hypothetical protein [Richelia sp. RM1_1_1]NJO59286.1 hypothetical protein [Richelia sp. RM2_1_2]